jgi:hypothetical protein
MIEKFSTSLVDCIFQQAYANHCGYTHILQELCVHSGKQILLPWGAQTHPREIPPLSSSLE